MKKIIIEIFIVGVILSMLFAVQAFAVPTPLSPSEKEGVLYMLEEERMALEVYTSFAERWDMQIFNNIKGAEKRHYSRLVMLADQYSLEIPTAEEGLYSHPDIQELYNEFVAYGSVSLEASLIAGAKIEETDIIDLEHYLANTQNKDLISTYELLLKGSENHLRAFNRLLQRHGINYEPDFLNEDRFDAIINMGVQCKAPARSNACCRERKQRCCPEKT